MNTEQYVEVRAGRESYAIPILEIHEIIRMQDITQIPNTKSCVLGVINLRGQIIPVVSLRERLGLPEEQPTKSHRIVVVTDKASVMGMIVDSVHQVMSFEELQPPPEDGNVSYLRGIGSKGGKLVSVLEIEQLIGS